MSCTVAKPLALDNVGMRMVYCADPSIGASFEVQEGTQRMSHIGGVLFFDIMELPESPKKIDKWIIRPSMNAMKGVFIDCFLFVTCSHVYKWRYQATRIPIQEISRSRG